mgnify:FL=1
MLYSLLKSGAANLQAPQRCVLCHDLAKQLYLCADCALLMARLQIGNEVCPLCAKPSLQAAVCGECQQHPPHFERLWASYHLDWPLHSVIAEFKYQQHWSHARALAAWMNAAPPPWLQTVVLDGVLAMPLSRVRLLERGYNQAALLVQEMPILASLISTPLNGLAVERQHRPPQSTLKHAQRLQNIRHVFQIKDDVNKRNLLLIDDVVTTSATLNELARTLKTAGAATVSCWVLARARMQKI